MKQFLLARCGLWAVLSGGALVAQETTPAAEAAASAPGFAADPESGAPAGPVVREEKRVFVPFEDLEKTLRRP